MTYPDPHGVANMSRVQARELVVRLVHQAQVDTAVQRTREEGDRRERELRRNVCRAVGMHADLHGGCDGFAELVDYLAQVFHGGPGWDEREFRTACQPRPARVLSDEVAAPGSRLAAKVDWGDETGAED